MSISQDIQETPTDRYNWKALWKTCPPVMCFFRPCAWLTPSLKALDLPGFEGHRREGKENPGWRKVEMLRFGDKSDTVRHIFHECGYDWWSFVGLLTLWLLLSLCILSMIHDDYCYCYFLGSIPMTWSIMIMINCFFTDNWYSIMKYDQDWSGNILYTYIYIYCMIYVFMHHATWCDVHDMAQYAWIPIKTHCYSIIM